MTCSTGTYRSPHPPPPLPGPFFKMYGIDPLPQSTLRKFSLFLANSITVAGVLQLIVFYKGVYTFSKERALHNINKLVGPDWSMYKIKLLTQFISSSRLQITTRSPCSLLVPCFYAMLWNQDDFCHHQWRCWEFWGIRTRKTNRRLQISTSSAPVGSELDILVKPLNTHKQNSSRR